MNQRTKIPGILCRVRLFPTGGAVRHAEGVVKPVRVGHQCKTESRRILASRPTRAVCTCGWQSEWVLCAHVAENACMDHMGQEPLDPAWRTAFFNA